MKEGVESMEGVGVSVGGMVGLEDTVGVAVGVGRGMEKVTWGAGSRMVAFQIHTPFSKRATVAFPSRPK